jgi:hypothetical protein
VDIGLIGYGGEEGLAAGGRFADCGTGFLVTIVTGYLGIKEQQDEYIIYF